MQELTYNNEFLNPWLLGLDILLILHFCYSYWRYCLRLGYRLDFWHFNLVIGAFMPVLVNYIFAGAAENRRWVGAALPGIQGNIDHAFVIQITGYICTYLGFYHYNLSSRDTEGSRGVIAGFTASAARLFRDFINSDTLIYAHLAFTLACGAVLILIAFEGGVGFDLRAQVLASDSLRPVYNFCFQAEGPILLGALWAKYLAERTRKTLIAALLILGMQLLSGARAPVILPMGTLFAVYAVTCRRKVRLTSIAVAMVVLLTLALGLQILRSVYASGEKRPDAVAELVYGNEYSDTRDFAWLLSKWDGEYVYGKTYLAGALGFLPRGWFLREFRETWAATFYQARFIGLDTDKHAGLRLGRYGELYLNFGYIGVILVGWATGYTCRLIDDWIKKREASGQGHIVTDFAITTSFVFFGGVYYSPACWTVYVMILVLLSSAIYRTLGTSARRRPVPLTA